jgi:hypothetical protein
MATATVRISTQRAPNIPSIYRRFGRFWTGNGTVCQPTSTKPNGGPGEKHRTAVRTSWPDGAQGYVGSGSGSGRSQRPRIIVISTPTSSPDQA